MKIASAAVSGASGEQTLADLFDGLFVGASTAPDFVALHGSVAHAPTAIQVEAARRGATALHGGTSCLGVMAGGRMVGANGAGIGGFAIWDRDGDYGVAARPIDDDPRRAGRAAMLAALEAAGRSGEAPDLVWMTAAPGCEEALLAGVEDIVGANTPVIGGSAADNEISGDWASYDIAEVHSAGVTLSALFPSRPVSWAYQNGYAPGDRQGVVTQVDGRRLIAIDGRPALEVYREWATDAVTPAFEDGVATILSESTFHPIGRSVGSVADVPFFLLAHPSKAFEDGSIELFADVDEGELLQAMTGSQEGLVSRAGRVAALAMKRGDLECDGVAGALMIYCAGCMLAVEASMDEVAAEVNETLGQAPSLGLFTFGEQGPIVGERNRHGNLMISCVVFSK